MTAENPNFEEILTTTIPHGSRREVAALISLPEFPGNLVLFHLTDDTRSIQLLDEEEAYGQVGVIENRRNRYFLKPLELHIISDLTKDQLKEIAKRASPKMEGNAGNRDYIVNKILSL